MARIFITGSTDGLGRAAAQSLVDDGHEVVLHARSQDRALALSDLAPASAGIVIGDLRSAVETRGIAEQVNAIGRMDAVIHNAGIYRERSRGATLEGHATLLAVNTLAPYILTALIERPDRLVYLSSSEHRAGSGRLYDMDWTERRWDSARAYAESKLFRQRLRIAEMKIGQMGNAHEPISCQEASSSRSTSVANASGVRACSSASRIARATNSGCSCQQSHR
jgi:NAD(P)-dependent dehydrogenase (short-subunit alcohol dehydrogenase family)